LLFIAYFSYSISKVYWLTLSISSQGGTLSEQFDSPEGFKVNSLHMHDYRARILLTQLSLGYWSTLFISHFWSTCSRSCWICEQSGPPISIPRCRMPARR
jgi:hypothetical protein